MSKHTPSPWRAEPARNKYEHIEGYWMVRAGAIQVADLFGLTGEQDEDGDDKHLPNDVAAANAHLIAAAPEMYAMLNRCADGFMSLVDDMGCDAGNWDGGSAASCEHCQMVAFANEISRVLRLARPAQEEE